MNCSDAEVLIHALIDGELDAGHARDVEAHAANCAACAAKLKTFRTMRAAVADAKLLEAAPGALRDRVEAALPPPLAQTIAPRRSFRASRRWFFGGFASGAVLSAAIAASLVLAVFRNDREQTMANEVVSAHIRSLQAGHLLDVETSDRHTVKPWFNGRLDAAPPVVELTAQGFTLLGGRLDYVDGEPLASIVYQRRRHVINLFVGQRLGGIPHGAKAETIQGYNVRHWTENGFDLWAVSDINADELDEFRRAFAAALQPPPGAS